MEMNRVKNDFEQNNDDNERSSREMEEKIRKQEAKIKELTKENQDSKNKMENNLQVSKQV